jgi:hypothetical protein
MFAPARDQESAIVDMQELNHCTRTLKALDAEILAE